MTDLAYMRLALRLARRGYGATSPNPMVGAVLVKGGQIIGRGWHRRAGEAHAEIEALRDAQKRGHSGKGATLHVTLEPCCTHGRTPPCTDAIIAGGIRRVVIGAADPNPKHSGRALKILRAAGIAVELFGALRSRDKDLTLQSRRLKAELQTLNEAFNHWIVRRTPFVTVKAAMTLDGKIATTSGESKWITGEKARACGMELRQGSDAILVGINTILADDPSLTLRPFTCTNGNIQHPTSNIQHPRLRRIILDSMARTPLTAKVVADQSAALTTIVVSRRAPRSRVTALTRRVQVLVDPSVKSKIRNPKSEIDLHWLLKKLGLQNVTRLLVEGGGEVNASFLLGGLAHRVAFFYAPKILGGRDSRKAVGGVGVERLGGVIQLRDLEWRRIGEDLLLLARIKPRKSEPGRQGRA
jgi:diaminohydroxyphosphoribosylaminopyrimidine deaminase/5-amino-6-(5-phosphoribosylamino)uracil reductase